ncbi:MAG: hypothetical protein SGJ20_06405 [Planctomycetota bacterium]|nr:hypothetical protein [Planctomycetota bacterium]
MDSDANFFRMTRNPPFRFAVLSLALFIFLLWLLLPLYGDGLKPESLSDVLLKYKIRKLQSKPGLTSGAEPIIYYYPSLGEIKSSDGIFYDYTGSTWISLDACGGDVYQTRKLIVVHLNSSKDQARQFMFSDRPEIRLASLDAVASSFNQHATEHLTSDTLEVLSDLAEETDPFIAGFPIVCLERGKTWSRETFRKSTVHPVAVVRAQAISYFEFMHERMSTNDKLEAMELLVGLRTDPHIGVRQLCIHALRKGYLEVCQNHSAQVPALLATADDLSRSWSDGRHDALRLFQDDCRADSDTWSARIQELKQLTSPSN